MEQNRQELIESIKNYKPVTWFNQRSIDSGCLQHFSEHGFTYDDMLDAEARLKRFAPLIVKLFPETGDGIIESPLCELPETEQAISKLYHARIDGKMYLKCDSHLKIAGSIKARGGIYEVLKHAEQLALQSGRFTIDDDYSRLAELPFKELFRNHRIAVGSTGNLGLSIGIVSAALGFRVDVHMSREAKAWKKQLLRDKGANVIEYDDDYSKAVEEGRKQCEMDENAYFIDDENSRDLFLGYSVAALRLKEQLEQQRILVDKEHQLHVYLPCGVGGAPGGITFGLKLLYGGNVHCWFVEPTHAPCMLLGLMYGWQEGMHVSDFGLDNLTEADGLAVGSPSKLVCETVGNCIEGVYTIEDDELFRLQVSLYDGDQIKVEPSAAASLMGPIATAANRRNEGTSTHTHICWATGGLLVPQQQYESMLDRGRKLIHEIE